MEQDYKTIKTILKKEKRDFLKNQRIGLKNFNNKIEKEIKNLGDVKEKLRLYNAAPDGNKREFNFNPDSIEIEIRLRIESILDMINRYYEKTITYKEEVDKLYKKIEKKRIRKELMNFMEFIEWKKEDVFG